MVIVSVRYDSAIVRGKLANLEEVLDRIAMIKNETSLASWMVDDLLVLQLQHGVQAAIDLANHLIARNAWKAPSTAAAAFQELATHGIIDTAFQPTLSRMVAFRNLSVHRYGDLDMSIVHDVVDHHLDDFRTFMVAVSQATIGAESDSEE